MLSASSSLQCFSYSKLPKHDNDDDDDDNNDDDDDDDDDDNDDDDDDDKDDDDDEKECYYCVHLRPELLPFVIYSRNQV